MLMHFLPNWFGDTDAGEGNQCRGFFFFMNDDDMKTKEQD